MSNDVVAALKGMSLHGMASAWPEVLGTARLKSLDHEALMHQLLKAESGYRDMRSMAYQMRAARFPAHRDLTGFTFEEAQVDEALVRELQCHFYHSQLNTGPCFSTSFVLSLPFLHILSFGGYLKPNLG